MNELTDIKVKFYHLPVNTDLPRTRLGQAFHKFKEAIKEEGVRAGTLKTIKAALQLHEVLLSSDYKDIRSGIGLAVDSVKVFNIPISISKIIQDRKSKLKTLTNTLDLISGLFAGLKILDYFKVLDLGIVSKTLGRIPTIGKEAAKILPFGNIVSVIEIIRSAFSIRQSHKEIKAEKIKKIKYASKRAEWKQIQNEGKIDSVFVKRKIASSSQKRVAALGDKNTAESKMTEALRKYTKRVSKHEILLKDLEKCKPSDKFRLKIATYRAFGRAKRARNEYEKALNKFQIEAKKWAKYNERTADWSKFEDMLCKTNQPIQRVKKLSELKVAKWDRKTLKSSKTIRDSKLSIGLSTTGIVVTVASMVLTFLALSTLPFASIPLTIAFVALAVIGVSISIWKKVRTDITYKAVPISMIWKTQGAVPLQAQA